VGAGTAEIGDLVLTICLLGAVAAVAGGFLLALPETRQRALEEIAEED
jgi:hypothetical protein